MTNAHYAHSVLPKAPSNLIEIINLCRVWAAEWQIFTVRLQITMIHSRFKVGAFDSFDEVILAVDNCGWEL